ncbi:DUF2059 domain-containing protein [Candidatus Sororendozoicomonas aggregata]|uniref:DUF2059 domain-containing protein n=1 Tax=Candidatus Sororendozoicomonas aggregata TaxID=3073239 RepID=UPI002ED2C50C
MKRFAALLLLLLSAFCSAGEKSQRATAEKLLRVNGTEQILKKTHEKIEQIIANQLIQLQVPPEKKAVIDQFTRRIREVLAAEVNWSTLTPPIIDAYINTYSEKTMKEATRFFASKAGQEILKHQPQMRETTIKAVQHVTEQFMPRLKQLQQEMLITIDAQDAQYSAAR